MFGEKWCWCWMWWIFNHTFAIRQALSRALYIKCFSFLQYSCMHYYYYLYFIGMGKPTNLCNVPHVAKLLCCGVRTQIQSLTPDVTSKPFCFLWLWKQIRKATSSQMSPNYVTVTSHTGYSPPDCQKCSGWVHCQGVIKRVLTRCQQRLPFIYTPQF